jgi:hypothetical protein
VPHQKLARLQSLFYELIRVDWGDMSHLVLPDLVALTELRVPEMWFPVGEQGKNKRAVVCFLSQYQVRSMTLT